MIREKVRKVSSGYVMLLVLLVAQLGTGYWIYRALVVVSPPSLVSSVLAALIVLIMWAGLFMVHPNEAKVLQLFGSYVGTAHEPGLKWANPFFQKTAVSTRVRNFESGKLKVNDFLVPAGELELMLREALDESDDKVVVLRGDKRIALGQAVDILDLAQRLGAKSVAIATEQPGEA